MDAEQEPAKVDLTLHSETLKDTAPVLEGVKVNGLGKWRNYSGTCHKINNNKFS